MRRELIALWERSMASREQLARQLQEWCQRAEASNIRPLVEFSQRLRRYACLQSTTPDAHSFPPASKEST
jgi:stearoyl-CoA desaturase (delta-9 desaturase)